MCSPTSCVLRPPGSAPPFWQDVLVSSSQHRDGPTRAPAGRTPQQESERVAAEPRREAVLGREMEAAGIEPAKCSYRFDAGAAGPASEDASGQTWSRSQCPDAEKCM
jgi:hypothetical protein